MTTLRDVRIIHALEDYARECLIERADAGEIPEFLGGPEETAADLNMFARAVSSLWAEMKAAIDDREIEWLELRKAGHGLWVNVADVGRDESLDPGPDRRRRVSSGCAA